MSADTKQGFDTSRAPVSQRGQTVSAGQGATTAAIGGLVSVTIDGHDLKVPLGTTILDAAQHDRHPHPDAVPPSRPVRRRRLPRSASSRSRTSGRCSPPARSR